MPNLVQYLDSLIKLVAPIHGVSLGKEEDKKTWRVDFKDGASTNQRVAAQRVIDEFDYKDFVESTAYIDARKEAYPDIGDQLDMIWHAMDEGKLPKNNDFYTKIKEVKDLYPKVESSYETEVKLQAFVSKVLGKS